MKILYAIQGTGNGHLARAMEVIPHLQKMAETDVMISGTQGDLSLPFDVKYRFYGLSFIFGTRGGVDLWKTLIRLRPFKFIRDIIRLPVKSYDLVLCDFEPVSAWACKLKRAKCVGISHQNAVLHPNAPRPEKGNWLGKQILKHYAPTVKNYGFHFGAIGNNVFSPVIRPLIRGVRPGNNGHYTVYLPSYNNDEIERVLHQFPQVQWQVFSKHNKETYRSKNIVFQPVSLDVFSNSFINCKGILCNAGFETPAEAIYMGKKLCVIPMKGQYEQACNAAFLEEMGIQVLSSLNDDREQITHWLEEPGSIRIRYPYHIKEILGMIILSHIHETTPTVLTNEKPGFFDTLLPRLLFQD
ncbi:MAG: glycosyltransferase family protein [Draconibacterium sp.]